MEQYVACAKKYGGTLQQHASQTSNVKVIPRMSTNSNSFLPNYQCLYLLGIG